MSRRRTSALLAAALALAAAGAARAATPLELVAPRAGGTLVGGSSVLLEWRATDDGVEFEEWEAFLSLDDGRSYPFRLTPHLDARHRRVVVDVPPYPTERARFLLRYGDEREERSVEVPGLWRIVASPGRAVVEARRLARTPGEAARPGDRGVAFWVAGDRDGGDRRSFEARAPGLAGSSHPELAAAGHALACCEPERDPVPALARHSGDDGASARSSTAPPIQVATRSPRAIDPLSLHVRRNE